MVMGLLHIFLLENSVDFPYAPSLLMPVHSAAVLSFLVAALLLSFHRLNYPCVKLSECIVWVLSWSHVTHSIFLVIIAVAHRRGPTAGALNGAVALTTWAHRSRLWRKSQAHSHLFRPFVYFFLVFFTKSVAVHGIRLRDPQMAAVVASHSIALSVPVALEALIVMLFAVAQNAFTVLEENVESLLVLRVQERLIAQEELGRLAEAHWFLCDYVDSINATFGLDMIICMVFNMARFVVFVYLTFVNFYALKLSFLHAVESSFGTLLELFDVAFRVFYMCYAATKVQTPAKRALITLREFCNEDCWNKYYYELVIQLIDQIKERKIQIIACNFLEVNLSFIEGLVATAFTYLLIFVQYNSKIKAHIISDSRSPNATSAGNQTAA